MLATLHLELLQQWSRSARQLVNSNLEAAGWAARMITPVSRSSAADIGAESSPEPGTCALVVGPGGVLSAAICQRLAEAGHCVAAIYPEAALRSDATAAVARTRADPEVLQIPCDVTDDAALRELVAAAEQRLGPIDVLVNALALAPAKRRPPHASGPVLPKLFKITRCVLEGMKRRGRGRIVNLSGDGGAGAVSDHGVLSFTRALARELAGHGITVNSVSPGKAAPGWDPTTADEIARLIVFLAAGDAAGISGMDLAVGGAGAPAPLTRAAATGG